MSFKITKELFVTKDSLIAVHRWNVVTTHNPSQNRKLMGEGAKNFLVGIAEKTDGSAFGDINRFLQFKHHGLHFKWYNYSQTPYSPYSKNEMFIISGRLTQCLDHLIQNIKKIFSKKRHSWR